MKSSMIATRPALPPKSWNSPVPEVMCGAAGADVAVRSRRADRNAEIAASLVAVEAERELAEFVAARNAEIKTAMMAYELQRTGALALAKRRGEALSIETGSIEAKAGFTAKGILPGGSQTLGGQACQSMIQDVGPIYWTRSTTQLDGASRKRLDALAAIASRCSSMVIEIHGHSDALGTPRG